MNKLMFRTAVVAFRTAYSATPLPANGAREQYLRSAASYDEEGRLWAETLADQDSGLQASLARAQLLIRRLPDAEALARGARVDAVELTSATSGVM
jgi:molybdopterin molybdotransferase